MNYLNYYSTKIKDSEIKGLKNNWKNYWIFNYARIIWEAANA